MARAEKGLSGSLAPHIHPKVNKDVADRIKAEEARLRSLSTSNALKDYDADLGITSTQDEEEAAA